MYVCMLCACLACFSPSELSNITPLSHNPAMASSTFCGLCLEAYDEGARTPRMLPACGHTFCTVCLAGLSKDASIVCPLDRKATELRGGVVVDVCPKNFALIESIGAQPAPGHAAGGAPLPSDATRCQGCATAHAATQFCTECEESYCDMVAAIHRTQRVSRSHHIVPLGDSAASAAPQLPCSETISTSRRMCATHTQEVSLFDVQCERLVCVMCLSLTHFGHKCMPIAEAAQKARSEAGATLATLAKHEEELSQAEKTIAEEMDILERSNMACEDQIRGCFGQVCVCSSSKNYASIFLVESLNFFIPHFSFQLRDALARREAAAVDSVKSVVKARSFGLAAQRDVIQGITRHAAKGQTGAQVPAGMHLRTIKWFLPVSRLAQRGRRQTVLGSLVPSERGLVCVNTQTLTSIEASLEGPWYSGYGGPTCSDSREWCQWVDLGQQERSKWRRMELRDMLC